MRTEDIDNLWDATEFVRLELVKAREAYRAKDYDRSKRIFDTLLSDIREWNRNYNCVYGRDEE